MTTIITVCETCQRDDITSAEFSRADAPKDGARLAALIEAAAAAAPDVGVRRHACLMGCSRACNVTLQAPGKIAYSLGGFAPCPEDAAAVVAYAALHAESPLGQVPYRQWPDGVKGHFVSRHLPLPEPGPD